MSDGYPAVIPMLAYEDGPAAMDWLARAFGFRERARMLGENGRLSHGEMEAGEGVIMLATPSPHYHGPKRHREESEDARKWSEVTGSTSGRRPASAKIASANSCQVQAPALVR